MSTDRIGFVVIGRNEGERLAQCLRPLLARTERVVYADSSSTDGSAELARAAGAIVTVLDPEPILSAARGRNAGFETLMKHFPDCEFVQFIDGDCILADGWLETAVRFLVANPWVALVAGRRFEANPGSSLYNRLIDEEWDTPVGQVEASGGDAMMRVKAFEQVGGFNPVLKAGEEPEMCGRLRAAGWELWRLDARMTEHDARLTRFGQWWSRCVRGGFGYAQVWSATGGLPKRIFGGQLRSAFFWTLIVPAVAILLAIVLPNWRMLLAIPAAWALQIARIAARRGVQSATMLMLAKLPETIGALSYFLGKKPDHLTDYKAA